MLVQNFEFWRIKSWFVHPSILILTLNQIRELTHWVILPNLEFRKRSITILHNKHGNQVISFTFPIFCNTPLTCLNFQWQFTIDITIFRVGELSRTAWQLASTGTVHIRAMHDHDSRHPKANLGLGSASSGTVGSVPWLGPNRARSEARAIPVPVPGLCHQSTGQINYWKLFCTLTPLGFYK